MTSAAPHDLATATPNQGLQQPVPDELRKLIDERSDVILSVATDIDLLGQYKSEWVIASATKFWVITEGASPEVRASMSLADVHEFRTIAAVGSGLLQVRTDGAWIDLVRYSNTVKYWFGRLAKRLDQLREGETIELDEEDRHDPRRCTQCGLMLQFAGETCPRCVDRGAAIGRVLKMMLPHWKWAAVMAGLLLAGIALDMVGPLLTRYLVDDVLAVSTSVDTAAPSPADEPSGRIHLLLVVVGVLAAVQLARGAVTLTNGRVSSRVGTAITFDMRGRLVEHLQKLSLRYYDKQQVGSLVGRVAYDTEAVQGFMSQLTAGFLMQILMVLFSAILMFSLAPSLAVWTLIPAPLVVAGSMLFYKFVLPHYHRFYDRSSKQAGMLSGMLSGIRVVKAFAQEERGFEQFQESSAKLRDARRKVDSSAATFYPLMGALFQVGGWFVWYVGGGRVLNQDLSLGTLMAFFGYLAMFYGPLASLTNLTTWVTQFTTQMHRIFEVLDTPVEIQPAKAPHRLASIDGRIEFKHVTFGYSRQTPILKNVTFTIEPGQNLGIVGHSGSGKTTIINLLSRFYDVDEGRILIDGVDVRDVPLEDLRRQMGVVLQEPFLFRGTIWDNLVYGKPDASVEQVIASSKAANSHKFVLHQYHAYDTWIGERGAGLSGGERQRLSIARAILCEPRILILDEATSSVDSESELAIQKALEELVKGRTSIIIAHRLSTLRSCDAILVVDGGKVVERGSHSELMAMDGKYARFVRLQSSAAEGSSIDQLAAKEKDNELEAAAESQAEADEPKADELPPITSHHPRFLTPENARIHLGNLDALHVTVMNDRIYHGVFALRCLPVTQPRQYISLCYTDAENHDQEVGLIRDLSDWPAEAQTLVNQALIRRYFVHEVTHIDGIEQWHNFLTFKVRIGRGEVEFIMRYSTESAQDYGEQGKMLLDVEENRYLIPDVEALPDDEQKLFERFIYW